jgi:hypothetical protein
MFNEFANYLQTNVRYCMDKKQVEPLSAYDERLYNLSLKLLKVMQSEFEEIKNEEDFISIQQILNNLGCADKKIDRRGFGRWLTGLNIPKKTIKGVSHYKASEIDFNQVKEYLESL